MIRTVPVRSSSRVLTPLLRGLPCRLCRYNVDRARTLQGDTGNELGLSLAAQIIDLHEGTITLELGPNVGVKVAVRLPDNFQ